MYFITFNLVKRVAAFVQIQSLSSAGIFLSSRRKRQNNLLLLYIFFNYTEIRTEFYTLRFNIFMYIRQGCVNAGQTRNI